jgi:N-acetylglutamate synthase-like GNAT family acetyltransferase
MPWMIASNYRVRRATLDDVRALLGLWQSMDFPAQELAKRVTEFQIAERIDGALAGAIGLEIAERQGRVHSEAFTDFALAEPLRPLLWERIQIVAANHGLLRLWSREQAPFWSHCGLAMADSEALETLPSAWREHRFGWRTVKLREDLGSTLATEHQFALFMAAEKERTKRLLRRAAILKWLAILAAVVVFIVAMGAAFYLIRRNAMLHGP